MSAVENFRARVPPPVILVVAGAVMVGALVAAVSGKKRMAAILARAGTFIAAAFAHPLDMEAEL